MELVAFDVCVRITYLHYIPMGVWLISEFCENMKYFVHRVVLFSFLDCDFSLRDCILNLTDNNSMKVKFK